ncbi:hypothetical protein [Flavobacterium sp.]|uniref:hypothetical protein n=1 Tax=Flavobacterium sp. TaxID=239 RepID=UPI003D134170
MKKLELNQMETFEGGKKVNWAKCGTGVVGGAIAGFAAGTGNGVALTLGPVGVTWGAVSAIGGALVGASSGCFD